MFSTSLLLLLAAASCYVHSEELTQPSAMTVQPGQSLSIPCKVSYSVTGDYTAWIRQPAGKALEWIGEISPSGSTAYSDKLKNKFSISRDTSTNTITIQGQNLQAEDTAVYYCARDWAFDYWGKGTAVTVTSATQEAPKSLFPAWQCGSSPDNFVTLGCLTRDLAIGDGLSYVWKDASGTALTTVVQYPAVLDSGKYSLVSQARVPATDWDARKKFTCEVTNSLGTKKADLQKPTVPVIPAKSLLLTAPSQTELDNGTATFICLASEFSPKTHTFKWTREKTSLDNKAKAPILIPGKNTYSALSVLELTASEWMGSTSPVKCEFQHVAQTLSQEASQGQCEEQPKMAIIPPSNNGILINRSADIVCKAEGPTGFTAIKWVVNGNEVASLPQSDVSSKTAISLTATISYEEWHTGTKFTCEVYHSALAQGFIQEDFQRVNGKTQCPELFLLPPPESSKGNSMTLTCYIKDFYPKEVAVSWLVGDKLVDNESTVKVIEKNGNFSAYSQLIVNRADWENGTVFTCNVYHESIGENVRHLSRSVAGNSNPPSVVNLSLNVPQNCPNALYYVDCLVLTQGCHNETETEDENVANTALTFVFLFLITLFYSIGVTVIKPKISWLVDGNEKSDQVIISKRQGESTVSNLTISVEDWTKWKTITCRAEHPCFNTTDFINKTETVQKTPSVVIRRSLADVGKRDSAVLECVASSLPSGELSVTFLANDDPSVELSVVSSENKFTSMPQKLLCSATGFNPVIKWLPESVGNNKSDEVTMNKNGRVKVSSELSVIEQEWKRGTTFFCQVNDQDRLPVQKNTSFCAVTPDHVQSAQVYLLGPSISDMLEKKTVSVICLLLGHRLQDFSVKCTVGKKQLPLNESPFQKHGNGTESVRNVLKVPADKWKNHETVFCEVKHPCSNAQTYNISKPKELKRPTIRIRVPSDDELLGSNDAALLCLIDGFFPADISVHWELDDIKLDASRFKNSWPLQFGSVHSYFMQSTLIISPLKKENGTFYCVVRHESSTDPIKTEISNIYASVNKNPPSVKLLRSQDELVCLAYGYSPSAINITWLLNTETVEHNGTSSSAKGSDGKFMIKSHLNVEISKWEPGSKYTCLVQHITGSKYLNVSKAEFIEQAIYIDENSSDVNTVDQAEETWNMACAFIILFVISLIYGCSITLVKVKTA
ncbi:uncharacterized protein LOC128544316 [Clarias gariepinus]|uniref:uncharacterized protein LOC128544316 n=1 Tax=Clarias gariepinus TaxID=13013 RepID=UPI00234C1FE3|nr:uncharacterized protein LOC128544316 [Clarias gariepinus]